MQISRCPICGGKLNSQEQRNKAQIYKDSGNRELLQKYTILQERYNDLNQRYETIQSKLQISAETRKDLMLMTTNQRVQLEQELIKKNREIIKLKEELKKAEAQMLYEDRQFDDRHETEFTFQPCNEVTTSLINEQSLKDDKPVDCK